MSKFQKFNEFLDKHAKTELIADGPKPKAKDSTPPQGKGAAPYKKGQDCKQMTMKGEKDATGLVNQGDKKLVKDTDWADLKVDPVDGKQLPSWGPKAKDAPMPKAVKTKTKTESFIEKTSKLSLSEFNQFMRKRLTVENLLPSVTALEKGKIYPNPVEAVRYVVALAKTNDAVRENLAHEIKRQGSLKRVLAALLDHPETYKEITNLLKDPIKGLRRRNNLSQTMIETVGNPIGFGAPKGKGTLNSVVPADDDELEDDELGDEDDLEGDDLEDMPPEEGDEDMGGMDVPPEEGEEDLEDMPPEDEEGVDVPPPEGEEDLEDMPPEEGEEDMDMPPEEGEEDLEDMSPEKDEEETSEEEDEEDEDDDGSFASFLNKMKGKI